MANATVQLEPLNKRLSRHQQAKRVVKIAARAHARDIMGRELARQQYAIVLLAKALEDRRLVNRVKRASSAVAGFFKPSRWQKQQAKKSSVEITKVNE